MRNARVAKRYARSLFEAAEQNDALEQVRQSVESFSAAFAQSPPLRALLRNPVIGAERKVAILREIFAQRTHPLFGAFLELVCLKGRENILDQIAEQFVELYNAWAGIVPGIGDDRCGVPQRLSPAHRSVHCAAIRWASEVRVFRKSGNPRWDRHQKW